MFRPLDNALWCAEFILELAGTVLFFKRFHSKKLLWVYLGFRAGADMLGFIALLGLGLSAYAWIDYLQRMGQFIFLGIVAICCLGAAVNADRRTIRQYGILVAGLGAIGIVIAHGAAPWTAMYLLTIGARADFILAMMIAGALLAREFEVIMVPMPKPWNLICWAILTAVSSHALASELLRAHKLSGLTASRLMACGQVVALALWIASAWKKQDDLLAVKTGLGQRLELPALPLVQDDKVHLWN